MIYDKTKTCTDMYSIIESFNIYWNYFGGGNRWFIKKLPKILSGIFTYGEVFEDLFQEN